MHHTESAILISVGHMVVHGEVIVELLIDAYGAREDTHTHVQC